MGIVERFNTWNSVSPAAKRLQDSYVRRFVAQHDPHTVTAEAVSVWIHNTAWKPNTRVAAHASIKKLFFWLCEIVEERGDNPMRKVAVPRPFKGVPRPVPEDLLSGLIGQVDDRDTDLMLRLGALQGLRCAEIATLRMSDVDFQREQILVKGKGGKVRAVPIHPEVLPLLVERQGRDYVFPSSRVLGVSVSVRTVARRVTQAMGGGFTAHQLRHRFASAVYEASGHNIRVVQELLGHASVATTQIYTAVSSDAKRNAVGAI